MAGALEKILRHPFIRMASVAGLGWLLDAAVYLALATVTGHVFLSNIAGNCCGIVFSFYFGLRRAFDYRGTFSPRHFTAYALFSFAMMPVFSALLAWIVTTKLAGLLTAKIIVTLPSFLANYLFLKWLSTSLAERKTSHG